MKKETSPIDEHDLTAEESQKYADAILQSKSRKKIVVAGPGTGKTYLFRKILEGKKNCLTLTFVNSLVEDLSLELCGLSEVRTLHSFALSIMTKAKKQFEVFPKLSAVIREDARILLGQDIDFDSLFHDRDDQSPHIEFYKQRKDYYGQYYGFSDIIFAAVKYLESNREKIPEYEQVLVDEFQDFNRLELSLIDLLAEKSPILVTGDDDQALYDDLKNASVDHIRKRWSDRLSDYEKFSLPHCRRCTRVIIGAVNDIIKSAEKNGLFMGRIIKSFEYFKCEDKDRVSDDNPKLIYTSLFAKQIPWFIEDQINRTAMKLRDKFSVLIISPFRKQSELIVDALIGKGFENIDSMEKKIETEPILLDGLKILIKDINSNLGWRIVSKFIIEEEIFKGLIGKSNCKGAGRIMDSIGSKKGEIEEVLKVLNAIKNNREVDSESLNKILEKLGVNIHGVARNLLRNEIKSVLNKPYKPGIGKLPIKATTIQSSKGLSADYIFITHFDDQYFLKHRDQGISDKDIRNFLVTLTRARRKVFLISSDTNNKPTFLEWIDQNRIEEVKKTKIQRA